MNISFKVRNLDKVQAMLKEVPYGTKGEAIEAVTDYLIGTQYHGLKHYPGYKYVSRLAAFGKVFFTDKQRRWFFWALKSGNLQLPYARTDTLRQGWEKAGDKYRRRIVNKVPYSGYVMGDSTQSRMQKKIGWRTISKVIDDNIKGAMRAANQAVARWLKKKEVK